MATRVKGYSATRGGRRVKVSSYLRGAGRAPIAGKRGPPSIPGRTVGMGARRRVVGTPEQEFARGQRNARMASLRAKRVGKQIDRTKREPTIGRTFISAEGLGLLAQSKHKGHRNIVKAAARKSLRG